MPWTVLLAAESTLDGFLSEAIKPAPSLAVLVWVVWKFLQYMDTSEKRRSEDAIKRDEALKEMAERTGTSLEKFTVAFDKNTEALGKNSQILSIVDDRILKLDSHLRRAAEGKDK